jgi:large subunit ribosomal protein L35
MPKIKTHQGTKKRVRITGKGKLRRRRANQSHNRIKKKSKQKRSFRRRVKVHKGDRKRMKKLIPYLS